MLKKSIILIAITSVIIIAWQLFNPLKEPTFKNIKSIEMDSLNGNIVNVRAIAVFNNPNSMEATLLNTELKVYSNDAFVGNVSQTDISEIAPKCDFELPLYFQIDLLKLGYSQSLAGLLENALNKEKVIPIRFEGYCRIKTLGATHKIPITFEDKLRFK